jgi:hypothetical protein
MTTKIAYLIHRLIAATPKENQMLKFIKNEMNRAKRKLIASISRLPRIAPMPMHHPAELIKKEVQPKIKIDQVVQKVQKKNSAIAPVQTTDEYFIHDLYSIEPTRVAVAVADTIISGNDGNFGGGGATGSYAQDSERQVLTPYIPPAPEPYYYSPSPSPSPSPCPSPSPSPSYDYYSSSESSSSDSSSFSCD